MLIGQGDCLRYATWRRGRAAECTGLENRRGNTSAGSNPAVSAVVTSRDMFDEPASQLAFLLGAGFLHGGVSLANRRLPFFRENSG